MSKQDIAEHFGIEEEQIHEIDEDSEIGGDDARDEE